MKVSLNWLKDYVQIDCDLDELTDRLTNIGFNLEEVVELPNDVVLDLEVTSNRSDCLGHIGIAREVAAVLGKSLQLPATDFAAAAERLEALARVEVVSPELCPRYTARLIRSVKIAPSPDWMVKRLEAVGLRGVNNVVDVTNYVLLEAGQPLHAFDYDKLSGHRIVVRPAIAGEKIVALDGAELELGEQNLIIADADRPVAVAGVMGGLETEVSGSTRDILLESAEFDPISVRRTARQLNLHSESSYRFERGVDPLTVEWASRRAARLICELAGGTVAEGVIDLWARPWQPRQITLSTEKIKRVLGIDVPIDAAADILRHLDFDAAVAADVITVSVPSHRSDVARPIDLVEEIGRLWGYDKIPTRSRIEIAAQRRTKSEDIISIASRSLTECGFSEAMTISLVEPKTAGMFVDIDPEAVLTVTDAQRRANNVLRPSLLPSLLATARLNQNAGNPLCELYELARVYLPQTVENSPEEQRSLALVSTGDLRVVRGALEHLLTSLGQDRLLRFEPSPQAKWFLPDQSAVIFLGDRELGLAGVINETVQDQFDLRRPMAVAELKFDLILQLPVEPARFEPLPRFPAIERDLSIFVDEQIPWDTIEQTIRQVGIAELETVEFGELFRGKQVPAGKKSIFLTLRFRHPQRSLTHDQVDEYQQRIVGTLGQECRAVLRS